MSSARGECPMCGDTVTTARDWLAALGGRPRMCAECRERESDAKEGEALEYRLSVEAEESDE